MHATSLADCEETPSPTPAVHGLARDVVILVIGSFLTAVFGALVVFVIPRITTVEDFGYWRVFLLYTSYVGFFHLGFGEGALLAWAGRPMASLHQEIGPSLTFLIGQHLLLLVPAGIVAALVFPPRMRFVALAVLAFALLQNTEIVLQCALQAARQFVPVAVATAAPTGLFLAFACAALLWKKPDDRVLIACYFLGWLLVLGYLWSRVHPFQTRSAISTWTLGKRYIAIGWPITLANTAFGLVQSSDRFVLSSAISIYQFAQYSLAASTMMVPVTLIAAIARVFFPHLAATERHRHPELYGGASRMMVLAWSVLLPYYFIIDLFVHHFLQAYVPILPVAGILLLGALFLAVIQILHGSVFNLYGKQKHFLLYALVAVAVSLGLAFGAISVFHSLRLVAAMQVLALGMWWLFNAWRLSPITGETWRDLAGVLLIFLWSAVSLRLAYSSNSNWAIRTACYWALTAGPLAFVYHDQMRMIGRFIAQLPLFRAAAPSGTAAD
jgi:O-antigen/teichoic acid export membrane protein